MSKTQAALTQRNRKGWIMINVALGSHESDESHVFVGGCDEGDFRIRRGDDVLVPPSVVERLRHAVIGVARPDPLDPTNPEKVRFEDRARYPFTVVGVQE